jgi:hypothetical protein
VVVLRRQRPHSDPGKVPILPGAGKNAGNFFRLVYKSSNSAHNSQISPQEQGISRDFAGNFWKCRHLLVNRHFSAIPAANPTMSREFAGNLQGISAAT